MLSPQSGTGCASVNDCFLLDEIIMQIARVYVVVIMGCDCAERVTEQPELVSSMIGPSTAIGSISSSSSSFNGGGEVHSSMSLLRGEGRAKRCWNMRSSSVAVNAEDGSR